MSGTVEAVGSAVPSTLQPGTEVYSRVREEYWGTASEYCLSTADATAVKPKSISHNEAASIPLATLTAYQAFQRAEKHLDGGLKGKTVYVPGGLSGVGASAVQLAKNVFKAGKVITTLSTAKIEKAEGLLGPVLDQIVDYTKEDPGNVIEDGSVDFMFDIMHQSMASLHLMKKGSIIVSVSGTPFGDDLNRVAASMPAPLRWGLNGYGTYMKYRARRYGCELNYMFMNVSAEDLTSVAGWVDQGMLKTVVGRVARLDDIQAVRDGCSEISKGKGGTGKFVIEV